jgi:ribosome-associated toxin RatA of RatAB toxin-antitoxin module
MARVTQSVLVMHPARAMFDLVDGVEHYPEFLPWCGGASVVSRTAEITVATIQIDYHVVKQSFTTRNTKQSPDRMDIALVDGPFRRLQGHWRFIPLGETACKIEFDLEYEFANRILEKLVGPIFSRIANTMVDSFVGRADRLRPAGTGG